MAKGFKVPIQVDRANGGIALVEGDDQASQIISLALADNDNNNPFQQDLGLGSKVVFEPGTSAFRALIMQRLLSMFAQFEKDKLFRLDRGSIRWTREKEGEQTLAFKFLNLESDEPRSFLKTFTPGSKR